MTLKKSLAMRTNIPSTGESSIGRTVDQEIGERIKQARKSIGKKQTEFLSDIGISNKAISNVEVGQTPVSADMLKYMADRHHINPLWVLTGAGNMILTPGEEHFQPKATKTYPNMKLPIAAAVAEPAAKIISITVDASGNEVITQVTRQARASYINAIETQEPQQLTDLPVISLPGPRWRHGTYRAFEVSGDSMQTTLNPGDVVVAERLHHWPTDIREQCVHVIVTHDDVVVKRVQNRLIETGQLVLQSDNTHYSDQVVDGDDVLEVWLCKAYISDDFTNTRYDPARELASTQADVALLNEEMSMVRQALEQLTGAPIQRFKSKSKKQ